jgi:TonB-dependent receptor
MTLSQAPKSSKFPAPGKKPSWFRPTAFVALFGCLSQASPAQAPASEESPPPSTTQIPQNPESCTITGEVSDSVSLDPIPGVIIDIPGVSESIETDANGNFSIKNLPPGNYNLEATKLGYFTEIITLAAIPSQAAEARFKLRAKPDDDSSEETMLEEETIIGEYQGDSQGDFNLSLSVDSPVLASSMDREEFTKTGVSDAGEAVSKISGANIVDGKYAVVRGLADRYVTTTFNGAQIASADPSRKAVQLDLFPTSAIEALKVDKTYSPHLSGDFGGGAIDILTRIFPEERILSASSKITYNDSLADTIRTHPNRSLGTFGDIGQAMPDVLEGKNSDGSINFLDSGNTSQEELKRHWTELHDSQDLKPKEDESNFGQSQSLTYGETFTLPNEMRLGLLSAFSRSSGDTSNTDYVTNQTREYQRAEFSRGAEWAAYLAAGLEFNENHRLLTTYFNKHIAQDDISNTSYIIDDEENLNYGNHLQNSAVDPLNFYGPDAIYYGAAWDVTPLERDLEILQFSGKHQLHDRGLKIDWTVTNSAATEQRPHSTHFEYGILDFSSKALANEMQRVRQELDLQAIEYAKLLRLPEPESYNWSSIKDIMYSRPNTQRIYDSYEAARTIKPDDNRAPVETSAHGSNSGSVPGKQKITRRTEKNTEDALHKQIETTLPYYFSEDSEDNRVEFSFGLSSLWKKRVTSARQYDLVLNLNSPTSPGFPAGSLDGDGGLGELIANDPSIISEHFDGTVNQGPYYTNSLTQNGLENIETELDQFSHYYNSTAYFGKSFLNAGVRFEKESYKIDIQGAPLAAFTDEQIAGNEWEKRDPQEAILPAFGAGTSIFDEQVGFQVAWSKTVARPTFWEFIPSQSLDQASGLGRRGNNELGQTDITNMDLAVTWQAAPNTTLRTSFFHKDLIRPLVSFYENGVLIYDDSFLDPTTSTQNDFTGTISGIEVEAELSNIGPFSLRGNFTYIDANLDYFYVQNGQVTAVSSQLPFQPTQLANLNLGYTYEPWLINANLVYNYNGDYPTILKLTPEDSEVSRNSIETLDLIFSKGFETDHANYLIKTGMKNLLNATDTFMYNGKPYNTESLGRSYWMEFQISF